MKVKLIIIQDFFSCSLLIKQGYWSAIGSDFQFVILSKLDGILCFLPIGSDKKTKSPMWNIRPQLLSAIILLLDTQM